jgi:predicted DNA-binding protein with PD1-like motif
MRSRLLHEVTGLRTFVVVMGTGDDAVEQLARFARDEGVGGAAISAVGACREATLAYFDPEQLAYQDIPVDEQAEVLSFLGDIALRGEDPAVHAHAVLGRRDGSTVGGHVQRLVVWPTLEAIVTESPGTCASGSTRRPGSHSCRSTSPSGPASADRRRGSAGQPAPAGCGRRAAVGRTSGDRHVPRRSPLGHGGTPPVWRGEAWRVRGGTDMAFAESRVRHDDNVLTRTPDLVRWGPVIAGVIIGAGFCVLLNTLWFAIAYSIGDGVGGALAWLVGVTVAVALFVSGWVAGALAGVRGMLAGLVNGVAAWALLLVLWAVAVLSGTANMWAGPPPGAGDAAATAGFAFTVQAALWTGFWSLLVGLVLAAVGGVVGGRMRRPTVAGGRPPQRRETTRGNGSTGGDGRTVMLDDSADARPPS